MGTKGPTGAGTQHTSRGIAQGIRLVSGTGNPIDVIDDAGVQRLAVDAQVTVGSISVDLDAATGDNVAIRNTTNADELFIQSDGTIGTRLRDGAGVLLTSTLVSGDQALDVNVVQSVMGSAATESDEASDSAGPGGDGLVPLTTGPDVIVSLAHTTGTYKITAIHFTSDRVCSVKLEVRDGATLVETIRAVRNSPEIPFVEATFPTPIEITGVATRTIRVVATRLQGSAGFASAAINGST